MEMNHKPLKDYVYKFIYDLINSGKLKPLEKINEQQICENLHVSRTPVREALIQLENEGFITRLPRPKRGFIVKEVTLDTIKQIYDIIGALEALAAQLALPNMNSSHIKSLRTLVEKMDSAIGNRNLREYFQFQRNFHDMYIEVSRNKELIRMLAMLKKRFIKKSYLSTKNEDMLYESLRDFNTGHKKIVDLFEAGDLPQLQEYLKSEHWSFLHSRFIVAPFETITD